METAFFKSNQTTEPMTMPAPRSPKRLMTIQELAEFTGCSIQTLYKMVNQRRIPYVKVGRLLRFDSRLIDDWLQAHTVMPMPERRV
jgi:excisionase family DNA binding protein